MSLKEKVNGNELDLSLNQLTEVPVKELAIATKATMLDISCNRIRSLPKEFATLTHLVKIDLSTNNLVELPDNFGNLYNLQYLDLYNNQLVHLPVSFSKLKNLRWLDLKNNPLEAKLKAVAGDCLEEKECQACAKKVVAHMQVIDSNLEREKQKKLKVAREKEAVERAKVEKELEEQRKLKKLEREKRKADSKAKREADLLEKEQHNENEKMSRLREEKDLKTKKKSAGVKNFFVTFMYLCVAICSLLFMYLLWSNNFQLFTTEELKSSAHQALEKGKVYYLQVISLIKYYSPIIKENVLKIIHQYMVLVTQFATRIEQMLSVYF